MWEAEQKEEANRQRRQEYVDANAKAFKDDPATPEFVHQIIAQAKAKMNGKKEKTS